MADTAPLVRKAVNVKPNAFLVPLWWNPHWKCMPGYWRYSISSDHLRAGCDKRKLSSLSPGMVLLAGEDFFFTRLPMCPRMSPTYCKSLSFLPHQDPIMSKSSFSKEEFFLGKADENLFKRPRFPDGILWLEFPWGLEGIPIKPQQRRGLLDSLDQKVKEHSSWGPYCFLYAPTLRAVWVIKIQ